MDGDSFYCKHDEEPLIVGYEDPRMDLGGNISYDYTKGYVCADPDCDKTLEGSPEEDSIDEDFNMEVSREY